MKEQKDLLLYEELISINYNKKKYLDVDLDIEVNSFKNIFEERLKELHITQSKAEDILSLEKKSLNAILNNEAKRVDVVTIIKLSQFLNIELEECIKFYLSTATERIREIEKTKKITFLLDHFDINELSQNDFISSKNDYEQIEEDLKRHLELNSIYAYSTRSIARAYSSVNKKYSDKNRGFWINSTISKIKKLNNINPYNRERLLELIPRIRPFSQDVKNGLSKVTTALYECGVSVIYHKILKNVSIKGATLIENNKPCIVLTNYGKQYPSLWITLMHELYHVLFDLEKLKKYKLHLSDEENLFLIDEDKANEFSYEYFIKSDYLEFINTFIDNETIINEFSKKTSIHPSMVYYIYCLKNEKWQKYSKYFPSSKETVDVVESTYETLIARYKDYIL